MQLVECVIAENRL